MLCILRNPAVSIQQSKVKYGKVNYSKAQSMKSARSGTHESLQKLRNGLALARGVHEWGSV
jgi:hypothetical protein